MKQSTRSCPQCHQVFNTYVKDFPRDSQTMVDIYQCDNCHTQWVETRIQVEDEVNAWFKADEEKHSLK